MPDASGLTPLHEACNGGHLSIAKMLVEHMQKVNPKAFAKYIEAKDKGGATVLHYAAQAGHAGAERASRAIYESVLEATADGVRTPDLGGHAGTTEFTSDVVRRVQTKIEVWSALGSTV